MNDEQFQKVRLGRGFFAALDQSGGSTPKALKLYGIDDDQYADDDEMFALMHKMRSRIMQSPSFGGDDILGAILFEDTMDREIDGRGSMSYLWDVKRVVPFLKVDKGLAEEHDGVQVMNPIPGLAAVLSRAKEKGAFGTKMRSFIKSANSAGIKAVVDQQFEVANEIVAAGLVPIIEPEVDIRSPEKVEAEELLRANILEQLAQLEPQHHVLVKLSLPDIDDFYGGPGRPPERRAGAGPVRRLPPRRRRRPPCPQPRRDRQFLARSDRGFVGAPDQRGVRRHSEDFRLRAFSPHP